MKRQKKEKKPTNLKPLFPGILVIGLALSIVLTLQRNEENTTSYNTYIENARSNAEDGLIDKALEYYDQALLIEDSADIRVERAQMLVNNERYAEALNYIEECRSSDTGEGKYYKFLLSEYKNEGKFKEFYELYRKTLRSGVMDEEIKELEASVKYEFYLGDTMYLDVGEFRGKHCAVYNGEYWGYIDYSGKEVLDLIYKTAGAFQSGQAPVQTETGEWYYINEEGIRESKTSKSAVESYVWNGVTVAEDEDGFYLLDKDGKEYQWTSKDDALPDRFDEIATDMYGMSLYNDRVFVRYDDVYHMVTAEGQIIETEDVIYDAKPFQDIDGVAAVCIRGLWGLMDKDGNVVVNPEYEETNSSCSGYAGVKDGNLWGYINTDGEEVVAPAFDEIRDMNPDRVAFVKASGGWRTLTFYSEEALGGE